MECKICSLLVLDKGITFDNLVEINLDKKKVNIDQPCFSPRKFIHIIINDRGTVF